MDHRVPPMGNFLRYLIALTIACGITAPSLALATDYFVSPTGNDTGSGSSADPFKTLQRASDAAQPGDTVTIRAGRYTGFNITRGGTASQRITFQGEPGAIIDVPWQSGGNSYGVNGSGRQYVTIQGLTFEPKDPQDEWYCCIRLGGTPGNWVKGNIVRSNTCRMRKFGQSSNPDKYGIYTSWNDGLLIEANRISGTYNSGIYAANSAKNYIIRGNDLSDLGGNGIHNNGDLSAGNPGINFNATIENNVITNVSFGAGGQAISCDGVQDSRIQNNLIVNAYSKGISLYATNAAEGCKRVVVTSNTVHVRAGGYVPMRMNEYSSHNTVLNNIFLADTTSKAWIDVEEASTDGMVSDYNVVSGKAMVGGSIRNDWGSTYGFDVHSAISTAAALFVDPSQSDFHLKGGSPAIDFGTPTNAPTTDRDGRSRPLGAGFDAGCFEAETGDTTPPLVINRTPPPNAISVPTSAAARVIFNEDVQQPTIGFVLRDPANVAVPASISYNPATRTATLTPNGPLAGLTRYTATVSGAKDVAGNPMVATSWSFTTAPAPAPGDSDGDGLSDTDELQRGTDPTRFDSDGDGIGDGQETLDGTNPLDRGSALLRRGVGPAGEATELCSDWNSFLDMWNIYEHANTGIDPLGVHTVLSLITGAPFASVDFGVAAGAQFDLLVHDMGEPDDSYGQICSKGSVPGALDGTMVYYRAEPDDPGREFELAFGMQVGSDRTGTQVIPFNTYDPENQGKLVANWITIVNGGSSTQSGKLTLRRRDGSAFAEQQVTLAAGERRDFNGHLAGLSEVGTGFWEPVDKTVPFRVRNTRYLFDNFIGLNSFRGAVALSGYVPTGEPVVVPADTRGKWAIVEVSNALPTPTNVSVRIYDAGGTLKRELTLLLDAFATEHVIANEALNEELGSVTVQSNVPDSVVAFGMHYRWSGSGTLSYLYGMPARQAIGSSLHGSFNTYLNQQMSAVLMNPTGSTQTAFVSLVSGSGTVLLDNERFDIPARGSIEVDISARVPQNIYGVVTIRPQTANTIVAHALRHKPSEFVVTTEIRQ